MNNQAVINLLSASSKWSKDSYGNYKTITENGRVYRLKIQKTSVRLEVKEKIVDKNEWLNIVSDYFKNLEIKDGKLKIKNKLIVI